MIKVIALVNCVTLNNYVGTEIETRKWLELLEESRTTVSYQIIIILFRSICNCSTAIIPFLNECNYDNDGCILIHGKLYWHFGRCVVFS